MERCECCTSTHQIRLETVKHPETPETLYVFLCPDCLEKARKGYPRVWSRVWMSISVTRILKFRQLAAN
jgi:hypothetical protein